MNSQFFRFKDIGQAKVRALQSLVYDFTNVMVTAMESRYERGVFPGLVIPAVDSMEVRQLIYENHKREGVFTKAIVDPRMGAETALLYVVRPMVGVDQQWYEKTLYSDSEALQERCTAKATIYTANMLSGLVCKAVKDILTRKDYLRTAQWDVKENEFLGFKAKEGA